MVLDRRNCLHLLPNEYPRNLLHLDGLLRDHSDVVQTSSFAWDADEAGFILLFGIPVHDKKRLGLDLVLLQVLFDLWPHSS